MVASHAPPPGDLASNPGMCPNWESNWRPFGLQAGTPSTEPHQLGLNTYFFNSPFPHVTLARHLLLDWVEWLCHDFHLPHQGDTLDAVVSLMFGVGETTVDVFGHEPFTSHLVFSETQEGICEAKWVSHWPSHSS